MDRAVAVGAYGERGAYALAVDDDGGFSRCACRDWLRVRVLGYDLDLAEVAAPDGSGSLLSCTPPSVLDLNQLRARCEFTVDVGGDLGLEARPVQALCGIWATGKYFLLARRRSSA